ncbi:MAG: hypothetical protein V3V78_03605 [Candidatus Woesearchaeota archaeon]
MKKLIIFLSFLFLAVFAILVYAQFSGSTTLTGTVKISGVAIDGEDNSSIGIVVLYGFNLSDEYVSVADVKNSTIDASGGYSFSSLEEATLYFIQAQYVNTSDDSLYISSVDDVAIIINDSFTSGFGFNSTYNVTFIDAASAVHDLNLEVIS